MLYNLISDVNAVLATDDDLFFSDDPENKWSLNLEFVSFASTIFYTNLGSLTRRTTPEDRDTTLVSLISSIQDLPPQFEEIYRSGLEFICYYPESSGYICGNAGVHEGKPWLVVGYGCSLHSALQVDLLCFREHQEHFKALGW